VRFFPSAVRVYVRGAIAALGLAGIFIAVLPLAYASDGDGRGSQPLKNKQHHVQHQVTQAQRDAEASSHAVSEATQLVQQTAAQLKAAYADLDAARAHVADVRGQLEVSGAQDVQAQSALDQAQAQLTVAQGAVTTGREQLDAQRTRVQNTVIGLYQDGDPQLLALGGYLTSNSPTDLTRRLEYSQTLVEDENSAFAGLQDAEHALESQEATAASAEKQVSAAREQAARQFAATQALRDQAETARAQAQQAKASLQATLAVQRDAESSARDSRHRDLATLAKLRKQEAAIKKQILAAAATNTSQGYTGHTDGYLSPPIPGAPITSPFGWRIHPIYHYWGLHDGTDFAAACGTPMLASADGTVSAAYWSDVYGNRLYIDLGQVNGHNLTINYNHAIRYVVSVGDHVTRGQVVGYVGTTGWSTGCHTHFTVLQDGTAVDPMTYIGGNT
jgi:murein DD-endopeptidase MepM/ murein hydrolase activator NlpD